VNGSVGIILRLNDGGVHHPCESWNSILVHSNTLACAIYIGVCSSHSTTGSKVKRSFLTSLTPQLSLLSPPSKHYKPLTFFSHDRKLHSTQTRPEQPSPSGRTPQDHWDCPSHTKKRPIFSKTRCVPHNLEGHSLIIIL